MRKRGRGQAMVEFALVAPVVLLLIAGAVDLGRGVLLYTLLAGASRDTARQAALVYNSGSNTLPPSCTKLVPPCTLRPVVQGAHVLDSLGVNVVYLDSPAISSPPAYGTFVPSGLPTLQPGTITLLPGSLPNTVYVFIYELDTNAPNPRWSCKTVACTNANGVNVRTQGHQRVVVDLKLRWQPVLARLLGIPASITFDSQAVERIEF